MFFFWKKKSKPSVPKEVSMETPDTRVPIKDSMNDTRIMEREVMESAEELYRAKKEVEAKTDSVRKKAETCIRKLDEAKKKVGR